MMMLGNLNPPGDACAMVAPEWRPLPLGWEARTGAMPPNVDSRTGESYPDTSLDNRE